MQLLLDEQRSRMIENGKINLERTKRDTEPEDFKPVVKLFCPWGGATWLLTELDPDNPDIAFGLCDLDMGCPELGNVCLTEIASVRGPAGLTIERDRHFTPSRTLQEYAREASEQGCIRA